MKTYLDCIPCFLKQAIEAARITGADEKLQKQIIDKVCKIIPDFPFDASPPQMAVKIHKIVRELTGNSDPYKKIKQDSQKLALKMYPRLKEQVSKAADSLSLAVEIAAIGNIIDFATNNFATIQKALDDMTGHKFAIFDWEKFKKALNDAKTVLYIGDNAGETVFDRVLLEEIPGDKKIYYGVRGFPAINDALEEDAKEAEIDKYAEIISNGSDAPGTLLNLCSREFKDVFLNADMLIAKGQGNFESLSGSNYPLFFLFKAKCPPVARQLNCNVGDLVLKSEKD
jgi:hypothetical protein